MEQLFLRGYEFRAVYLWLKTLFIYFHLIFYILVSINRLIPDRGVTHKINSLSLAAITKIFVRKVKWNTPYRSPEVYTFEFSTRVYTSVENFTRWLLCLTSNSLLCIRGRIFFFLSRRKSIAVRDVFFKIRITKSFIRISLVLTS